MEARRGHDDLIRRVAMKVARELRAGGGDGTQRRLGVRPAPPPAYVPSRAPSYFFAGSAGGSVEAWSTM